MSVLEDSEIERWLDPDGGWRREGDAIVREFVLEDFADSVRFVNALLAPAEEMAHHPDLSISWNRVTVSLSTHSEGGITEADFRLAEAIDSLA